MEESRLFLGDLELETAVLVAGGGGRGVQRKRMAPEEGLSLFEVAAGGRDTAPEMTLFLLGTPLPQVILMLAEPT